MKTRNMKTFLLAGFTCAACLCATGSVSAQFGGGGAGGGFGGTGGFDTGGINTGGINTGGINTGGAGQVGTNNNASGATQTGNVTTAATQGTIDPSNAVQLETSDDLRNQGFVGATAPGVQELGYVGATSENSGPPLVSGRTFGGGVNSTGGAGAGAGAGRAGVGGFANQGFGAAGAQNGFTIIRQNMRARLVPSFSAPVVSAEQMINRFNNGFSRQPESQNFSGSYQVSIAERTATITGYANSQADADRIVRQLRLQPGVYKIENQLQVGQ